MFLIYLSNSPQKTGWVVLPMGCECCYTGMTLCSYLWDFEKVSFYDVMQSIKLPWTDFVFNLILWTALKTWTSQGYTSQYLLFPVLALEAFTSLTLNLWEMQHMNIVHRNHKAQFCYFMWRPEMFERESTFPSMVTFHYLQEVHLDITHAVAWLHGSTMLYKGTRAVSTISLGPQVLRYFWQRCWDALSQFGPSWLNWSVYDGGMLSSEGLQPPVPQGDVFVEMQHQNRITGVIWVGSSPHPVPTGSCLCSICHDCHSGPITPYSISNFHYSQEQGAGFINMV